MVVEIEIQEPKAVSQKLEFSNREKGKQRKQEEVIFGALIKVNRTS